MLRRFLLSLAAKTSIRSAFGHWRKALVAAGVNVAQLSKRAALQGIERKRILREIRERKEAGLSIRCKDVCLENRDLANAAVTAFRSWSAALHAAGLGPPPSDRSRKWSEAKVLAAIQERHQAQKPCQFKEVRQEFPALSSAARRYFGSWRLALAAAGIASLES